MTAASVAVTVAAALAIGGIAVADLVRAPFVLANARAVGVPERWLTPLGLAKGAGAVGLVLGLLGVPVVDIAAGVGLTAFFVGAVATHLRAGDHHLAFPLGYLTLATSALVVALAEAGLRRPRAGTCVGRTRRSRAGRTPPSRTGGRRRGPP